MSENLRYGYNVLRLCAAALDKLNNSASTVQRWRKTAVIRWHGLLTTKLNKNGRYI